MSSILIKIKIVFNSFQRFVIKLLLFYSYQLISTAYSDDFAIIIDQYNNTLKMVQLILKK
jgi:hypothetical protein